MCGCDDERAMCSALGVILSVVAVLIGAVFLFGEDGGGMKCCLSEELFKKILFTTFLSVIVLFCIYKGCCIWRRKIYPLKSGSSIILIGDKNGPSKTAMNSNIKYAVFPDGDTIENYLFFGCCCLESVCFNSSVTKIGAYAFAGCGILTGINLNSLEKLNEIKNGAFLACAGLEEIVLPESVTKIGDYAFAECTGLRSVTIKNPSMEIGESVFRGCGNLKLKVKGDVSKYKELLKDYASYGINDDCKVSLDDGSEKRIDEFLRKQ